MGSDNCNTCYNRRTYKILLEKEKHKDGLISIPCGVGPGKIL